MQHWRFPETKPHSGLTASMLVFGCKDRVEISNREIHDESSPDQWRYVPTKLNPADLGTRGALVQELATDDCWWHGPSFLQCGEDEWPERKFGKVPEAYKEVKSKKRGQFEKNEPSNNAQSYYVETVKSKSEPDPTDY